MDIVRRIVREAGKWLTEDGMLVVEIGNERDNVEAAFGGLDLVWLSTSAGDDNVFLCFSFRPPTCRADIIRGRGLRPATPHIL